MPHPSESTANPRSAPAPAAPAKGLPRTVQTLLDGRQVAIRPLTREDASADQAFIEGLSPQSRRERFLGHVSEACAELVRQLTDLDGVDRVAYAAVVPAQRGDSAQAPERERIIGVARYGADPDRRHAECAIAVADAWHKAGLGTALMTRLVEHARAQGFEGLYSIDDTSNIAMRELAADLGFKRMLDPDDPSLVRHVLDLKPA
jgi:GNAT superfamily N-acetyltransferase